MKNIKSLVRDLDLYAKPVNFRFRGREKFQTLWGGCLSCIIILVLTVFFIIEYLQIKNNLAI